MTSLFEAGMLICFGLSWPFNIAKSVRSRTAKGKSVLFELLILLGYILGILGKIVNHNVNYLVAIYTLDMLMIAIDLAFTFRNRRLDRMKAEP